MASALALAVGLRGRVLGVVKPHAAAGSICRRASPRRPRCRTCPRSSRWKSVSKSRRTGGVGWARGDGVSRPSWVAAGARGGLGPGTEVAEPHQAPCRRSAFGRPLRTFYSAASTLPAPRRRTRLAQYGGPRAGVRFGTSVKLANAPQVPSDAGRIGDEREQLHPSAAARAGQNVEPKAFLE